MKFSGMKKCAQEAVMVSCSYLLKDVCEIPAGRIANCERCDRPGRNSRVQSRPALLRGA